MGNDLPDYQLGISILAQALASLTAVVSATDLNIRALASRDKAHVGIPYDSKSLPNDELSVVNNSTSDLTYTEADWGADDDWVTYAAMVVLFDIGTDFMTKRQQGFHVRVFNDLTDLTISKSFSGKNARPLNLNGIYYIGKTIFIPGGFFSSSSQTLHVKVDNYTGQTVNIASDVMGIVL